LQSALWGVIAPKRKISIKSGQFSPLDGGNVNASSDGYTAGERANPWDLILATEGCLLFYSTAARRHGVTEPGELTCPFTVRSSALGYASAAPEGCRAESWLPLWSTPSGLLQLKALFREGRYRVRSGVSDRPARDGLDFARAISTLGEKRKIDQFIRYGFLERNGKAHYAVPLGRFQPKYDPQVNCLAEIDAWVNRLRSSSRGENVPLSIKSALRQLEMSLFDLTQGKATLLDVLIALGKTERDLARSPNFVKEHFIDPVPLLQTWIENVRNAQQDIRVNSAEFRLALSLAGTGIRQRIVPVKPGRYPKWDFENPATVWSNASLSVNLVRSLRRKTIEAEQKREAVKPAYPPFATLSDISDWIFGSADPSNIEAMAHGLSLCNLYGQQIAPQLGAIPIAYSLPAICHHWCSLYRSTSRQEGQEKLPKWVEQADLSIPYTYGIPYVSGMFNRLAAGDSQTATTLAIRRLRASGINPITSEGITSEGLWGLADQPLRIAAALAFPIGDVVWKTHEDGRKVLSGGVKFLIDQVQIKEKKKDESV
jgi:CRISPR-associated protein Csx17